MMTRDELLNEGVAAKFMRYVRIDTQSDDEATSCPSTKGQMELAELLKEELQMLGLTNAVVDNYGFVTASLPSNQPHAAPVIGFLAHMDTALGVSGKDVQPILHKKYGGGDIVLPGGTIRYAENPLLAENIGNDLITSDGNTLLGADNKAGVAEIMEALCRLIKDPAIPHGTVKVAFTPDEETGKGIHNFDVGRFGADYAYTLDGGELGEIEGENFNAANLRVTIYGISSHTGDAKGKMVNALHLASELIASIPAGMRPETTEEREGFIHPDTIEGSVEKIEIKVLLRDFESSGLRKKEEILRKTAEALETKYPGSRVEIEQVGGYQNMKVKLDEDPRVMEFALQAIKDADIKPKINAVRGGTDGARLSYAGLLTPNLFTGGVNFHSRQEWISVQWMEKAIEVVLNLIGLWSKVPGAGERKK